MAAFAVARTDALYALIGQSVAAALLSLGKGLAKDAAALKDYLGAYVRVYPLGENEAGGIYLRREGVYEMRCFRAETSEGKIVNVTRFY